MSRRALEYAFLILSSMSNIPAILFSPEMTLSQLNSFECNTYNLIESGMAAFFFAVAGLELVQASAGHCLFLVPPVPCFRAPCSILSACGRTSIFLRYFHVPCSPLRPKLRRTTRRSQAAVRRRKAPRRAIYERRWRGSAIAVYRSAVLLVSSPLTSPLQVELGQDHQQDS